MNRFIYAILFMLLFYCLFSCSDNKEQTLQSGVIITFDDAFVDEWFDTDQVLKKYNWKATFNVCRIDSICAPQLEKLHQLENEGHEISGYGYHHYNAVKFVAKNGMEEYLKQEIDPMIKSMKEKGFHVSSFAYPYGERSDAIDKALNSRFKIIRDRAFCGFTPEKEGCYFHGSKFVYAFDIDNSHVHFSYHYLLELLDYAKRNNKIIILCSHKPVKNVTANYQTKIETLELICTYMKLNNMKFYTLRDLDLFVGK